VFVEYVLPGSSSGSGGEKRGRMKGKTRGFGKGVAGSRARKEKAKGGWRGRRLKKKDFGAGAGIDSSKREGEDWGGRDFPAEQPGSRDETQRALRKERACGPWILGGTKRKKRKARKKGGKN